MSRLILFAFICMVSSLVMARPYMKREPQDIVVTHTNYDGPPKSFNYVTADAVTLTVQDSNAGEQPQQNIEPKMDALPTASPAPEAAVSDAKKTVVVARINVIVTETETSTTESKALVIERKVVPSTTETILTTEPVESITIWDTDSNIIAIDILPKTEYDALSFGDMTKKQSSTESSSSETSNTENQLTTIYM